MLERFAITIEPPSRALNRWVSAVIRLFRPQIVDLIRARDETIASGRDESSSLREPPDQLAGQGTGSAGIPWLAPAPAGLARLGFDRPATAS